jgi:hypothetical protein
MQLTLVYKNGMVIQKEVDVVTGEIGGMSRKPILVIYKYYSSQREMIYDFLRKEDDNGIKE